MALIECQECKKMISEKASRCPHCGAPKALRASPIPAVSPMVKPRRQVRIRISFLLMLAIIIGVSYWVLKVSINDRIAPVSAWVIATFRQPKTVVDERVELKPVQINSYNFRLKTDSKVEVQVQSVPQYVNVMIMEKKEAEKFRQSSGKSPQGGFTYIESLSSEKVHQMDKTEILHKGEWVVVVFRPLEASSSQEGTSVKMNVTVY